MRMNRRLSNMRIRELADPFYGLHELRLRDSDIEAPCTFRRCTAHPWMNIPTHQLCKCPFKSDEIVPRNDATAAPIHHVGGTAYAVADQHRAAARQRFVHRQTPSLAIT